MPQNRAAEPLDGRRGAKEGWQNVDLESKEDADADAKQSRRPAESGRILSPFEIGNEDDDDENDNDDENDDGDDADAPEPKPSSRWQRASPRSKGLAVALFGVLLVSPDAVCVRWLRDAGVEPWSLLTWKMTATGSVASLFAVTSAGGLTKCYRGIRAGGWHVAIGQSFQAVTDIGFTMALVHTSAAHTILLVDLNPLWAALLGYFFLGEIVVFRTKMAMAFSLLAIFIIFVPSMSPDVEDGGESVTAFGDLIAAATGAALAVYLTIVRLAARDVPKADMTAASALGGYFAAFVALCVSRGQVLPSIAGYDQDKPTWQFFAVVFADGLCVGGIFVCLSIAPRLCSAPEVGLVLLLESVLGPLWVFVGYGDVPNAYTLAGGGLLLAVLAAHELAAANDLQASDGKLAVEADESTEPDDGRRANGEDTKNVLVAF